MCSESSRGYSFRSHQQTADGYALSNNKSMFWKSHWQDGESISISSTAAELKSLCSWHVGFSVKTTPPSSSTSKLKLYNLYAEWNIQTQDCMFHGQYSFYLQHPNSARYIWNLWVWTMWLHSNCLCFNSHFTIIRPGCWCHCSECLGNMLRPQTSFQPPHIKHLRYS